MREIKFRGYAKEELVGSQWVCDGFGVTKIEYTDGTSSVHILTPRGNYEVYEESVGQYTGVKNKEGVEICEGDIVEYFKDELSEIKYENGAYIIENSSDKETIYDVAAHITVVGNKFENSDLLKNKN